jgi:hypothetical protein
MNLPISDNILLVKRAPHFGEPSQIKEMVEQTSAFKPGLYIIDTIAASIPGADENSAKDMGAFLQSVTYIEDQTKAFVLGVHHMGKDTGKGSRGWSGLPAAADMEIQVTPNHRLREANVLLSKSRDAERWQEREVWKAVKIDLGLDSDGDPYDTLAFRHEAGAKPSAAAPDSTEATLAAVRWPVIRATLQGAGKMSTKALAKELVIKLVVTEPEDHEAAVIAMGGWLSKQVRATEDGKLWTALKINPGSRETTYWRTPKGYEPPEPPTEEGIPW